MRLGPGGFVDALEGDTQQCVGAGAVFVHVGAGRGAVLLTQAEHLVHVPHRLHLQQHQSCQGHFQTDFTHLVSHIQNDS